MSAEGSRQYSAGDTLEDLCRACKLERYHTVVGADSEGRPARVVCDYCGSQHNYRGGVRKVGGGASVYAAGGPEPMELVSERERSGPAMSDESTGEQTQDLELLLRRIIREEAGLTPVAPADKWRGGEMVLRPGRPGVQEKSWPIETFFHKVVMIRNRLRVLEQQINGVDELPQELKLKLQGYITACYGSLTSLNVLFADDDDRFHGAR